VSIILFLLFHTLTSRRCGDCVGRGEVCGASGNNNFCVNNHKCVSINDGISAPVCLPTVEKETFCNDTKEYDPCETGFRCQRDSDESGKCETTGRYAAINDGCESDQYCLTGLTCSSKVCTEPANSNLDCNDEPSICKLNQNCTFNGGSATYECKDFPGDGSDCSSDCQYDSYCDQDTKRCVKYFSKTKNQDCTDIYQCQTGLECNQDGKCLEPKLYILWGAPGIAWGQECDPEAGDAGCNCNYGSHTYRYELEYVYVVRADCPNIYKEYNKCLLDHDCRSYSRGDESCLRKNCYNQYLSSEKCDNYADDTEVPTRCGSASSLSLLLIFLVFVQFLF